jgi:hypothetical protein
MASITVIGEDGAETTEIASERFGIAVDGDSGLKYPAATTNIEVEKNGNIEKTGTQCGDMRQANVASDPFAVRVECIITTESDSVTDTALTVRDVLHKLDSGEPATIVSDFPIEKSLTVRNVLVTQTTDIVSVSTDQTDGRVTAFECQLQLGAETNDE